MLITNAYPKQGNQINLRRLVWLRVVAIIGQFFAVFFATQWLHVELPTKVLFLWITIYACINIATLVRSYKKVEVSLWEFFFHLLIDVAILTILLSYSGGGANPFVSLYLLPITIAAITLPPLLTWVLAGTAVACYSVLMWVISPLEAANFHVYHFEYHTLGMWLGFVVSAILVSFFVVKMGRTIHAQQQELAQQKEDALRNEQFVRLGTLAASTAHELGTPLGTMQLTLEELDKAQSSKDPALKEHLYVLKDQIARCKDALSILSSSVGKAPLLGGQPMTLEHFVHSLLRDWQQSRPEIYLESHVAGESPGPKIVADKALQLAIKNVLNNAADVSPTFVACEALWDKTELTFTISDHGPGLTPNQKDEIGKEPYPTNSKGLGLGLFLSHGVIRRFGGTVTLNNLNTGGLQTTISLPLQALSII